MRKRLNLALALALVVGALLLAPGGANAAAGGTAITSSGIAAYGWAGPFTVTFVVPTGSTTDAATIPGVDLGKPWGSLFRAAGSGDLNGVGSGARCQTVVSNPSRWNAGHPTFPSRGSDPVPLSGIYFDVSCDDGSGYDFYRVRWDDEGENYNHPFPCSGQVSPISTGAFYWGSGVQNDGYHGTLGALFWNGCDEAANLQVWGHDAEGLHLVSDGGAGRVAPRADDIVTTVAGT